MQIIHCRNTNKRQTVPGELSPKNMISSFHTQNNETLQCGALFTEKVQLKWFGISLVFIWKRTSHAQLEIWNFFPFVEKKRYSISLVHSTKQTMMFYHFRKISSQYGTEMLQTKQPQQELGKFLCKFISKNHRISKSPPHLPPSKYKMSKFKMV